MTVYLWDASNYDWQRDADHMLNFRAARADGIAGVQHKATEGHTYTDPHFGDFARLVNQGVGFAVVGPYHVAWPDDTAQWDHWFDTVEQLMPWWRDYPGVVNWQIDAEKFANMPRMPNLTEIHAGVDRIMQRGGNDLPLEAIVTYAPDWLYGDTLRGLRTKLWASDYGPNLIGPYRSVYPGDASSRWAPYSGITPALLQYGSRTVIGEQSTCDASAVRVASEAALQALFRPAPAPPLQLESGMFFIHTPTRMALARDNDGLVVKTLSAAEWAAYAAVRGQLTPAPPVVTLTEEQYANLPTVAEG